ncbi:hypothetical protein E4H04_13390 [Candidatus Bathyarchaeota archaeon]|nr:MAG: hypothetical protein E4H04_13390 [Candidatus Bathyarchaeota archaeon]
MSKPEIKQHQFVDVEQTIRNTNTETVFDIIIEWCNQNNAKITKQTKPNVIEASHGKTWSLSTDYFQSKKKITFILNQEDADTILRIVAEPPWYERNVYNLNEAKRRYYELLEPLWTKLNVDPPMETQVIFSMEELSKEPANAMRTFYIGLIVLCAGFSWALFGELIFDIPWIEYVYISGGLYMMFGYWSRSRALSRIRKTDPDFKIDGSKNRVLRVLALVIVVCSIGLIGWSFSLPTRTTFDGYGFSFEHNRWWKLEPSGHSDSEANVDNGMISIHYTSQYDDDESLITMLWVTSLEDDSSLRNRLSHIESTVEYSFDLSETKTRIAGEKDVLYREGTVTISSTDYLFRMCIFYDESSGRVFTVNVIASDDYGVIEYVNLIDSFQTD